MQRALCSASELTPNSLLLLLQDLLNPDTLNILFHVPDRVLTHPALRLTCLMQTPSSWMGCVPSSQLERHPGETSFLLISCHFFLLTQMEPQRRCPLPSFSLRRALQVQPQLLSRPALVSPPSCISPHRRPSRHLTLLLQTPHSSSGSTTVVTRTRLVQTSPTLL